jgi:hypothetical protein
MEEKKYYNRVVEHNNCQCCNELITDDTSEQVLTCSQGSDESKDIFRCDLQAHQECVRNECTGKDKKTWMCRLCDECSECNRKIGQRQYSCMRCKFNFCQSCVKKAIPSKQQVKYLDMEQILLCLKCKQGVLW